MTRIVATCAIALVCIVAANAKAEGISKSVLDQMGLSGMEVLSDSDALAVRGKGFFPHKPSSSVHVWGHSNASIGSWKGNASAKNGYEADGRFKAKGSTASEAGKLSEQIKSFSIGGFTKTHSNLQTTLFFSGGSSSASAR